MIYVRVVEALQYGFAVCLQLFLRQVECLEQLIEHHFMDVLAQYLVVASIANDVDAGEVCYRREHGVRAVEKRHFALVVRFLALSDEDVQTGFVSRELCLEFSDGHVLRFLDNPEVENLSLYDEVVVVAHFLLNLSDIFAREARYDTVHECSADVVIFLEPVFESLVVSAEIIFPELDVLTDAVFEVVSIEEDEFAGHEDKTFGRVAVECLVAAEEKLHEFTRIRRSRSVGELTAVIEGDTCLGSIGDDEADLRLLSERHESPILGVGVQRTRDDIDTLEAVNSLTVQTALQVDMIQAVLTVEPLHHSFVNRLNDSHRTVEVRLCVHVPHNPVHESAEEVTFTKLDNSLGSYALRRGPLVQCFFCHSFKY